MLRSMTAFARREAQGDWGTLVWEIRSVNHRYLEPGLRLPEEFRAQENAVRERLQARLGRGKIECGLRYQAGSGAVSTVDVNLELARAVIEACDRIEKEMSNAQRQSAIDILRWPGVAREAERDMAPVQEAALGLLEQALDELVESREREGARLQAIIEERAAAIGGIVTEVRARRVEVMQGVRDKLLARIQDLGVEADPGRLEQELAIIAQRLDVDEELDRLDSHLKELAATLARDEPVGRRLDFLMQEFNREANTLGSKANDTRTTQAAVELKVLIEQMREQVQNIE